MVGWLRKILIVKCVILSEHLVRFWQRTLLLLLINLTFSVCGRDRFLQLVPIDLDIHCTCVLHQLLLLGAGLHDQLLLGKDLVLLDLLHPDRREQLRLHRGGRHLCERGCRWWRRRWRWRGS